MHVRAHECALGCDSTLQKLSKIGQEHLFVKGKVLGCLVGFALEQIYLCTIFHVLRYATIRCFSIVYRKICSYGCGDFILCVCVCVCFSISFPFCSAPDLSFPPAVSSS